jgi:hypothetical protein
MEGRTDSGSMEKASIAGPASARKGWTSPRPDRIPRDTYAPAAAALGITFVFWGVVTTPIISVVGIVLFGISLAAWIGEAQHELNR